MAQRKEELRQFLEETAKYTETIEKLGTSRLTEDAVQSLLKLVRGIDSLLTRQDQAKDNGLQLHQPVKEKVPAKKAKQKQLQVEFDVGIHKPKNFNTPLIPLDKKNCPGLNETRADFRTHPAPAKKRK